MTKTYKELEADLKAKQCGRCKGEGTLEECTVDQFPLTCPDCNGTGLLKVHLKSGGSRTVSTYANG